MYSLEVVEVQAAIMAHVREMGQHPKIAIDKHFCDHVIPIGGAKSHTRGL